jgi:hypothetical protein
MKTVTVNYDELSGSIYDMGGALLCVAPSGWQFPNEAILVNSKSPVDEMATLKESGFTADEIMQMKREGLF